MASQYFSNMVSVHPINASLTALQSDMASLDEPTDESIDERLHRIDVVLGKLHIALRRADPNVVPLGKLQGGQEALQNVKNSISAFRSQNNAAYLDRANVELDPVLELIAMTDRLSSGKVSNAASEIINEIRHAATASLAGLNKSIGVVADQVVPLERRADEVQAEIERKAASFGAELQRFSQRYESEEEQRRNASDSLLTAKKTELKHLEENFHKQIDTLLAEASSKLDALVDNQKAAATGALEQLERDRTASAKLLGIVGETGTIGGYQREANFARREGQFWNAVALAGLVWVVVEAYVFLRTAASAESTISWEGLVARGLLLAVSGVVAAFATRQSARAHRIEESFRRLELQLASVGPFIAGLPPETQEKIKSALVDTLYGKRFDGLPEGPDHTPTTAAEIIASVLKELPQIIKATK